MRLPRRVPWSSTAELDQLCALIYADENDIDAKVLALQRLSAWKVITTLPHALESTLAVLTVMVQDASPQTTTSSYLHIRQSYASALIRLVNGLVDPLQLGAYARSIASIAAQLHLPAWLVELRHAATHEDLPSIEVLREAARDSMTWLLHNYFLPSINPSLPLTIAAPSLRPVTPLLKQYKGLLKLTARDLSLKSKYKPEITKVLRDIERWIAEAKVSADVSMTLEWDDADKDEAGTEGDHREQWALEKLSDALMEKGGLVPVSKRKRAVNNTSFTPPSNTVAIWAPLIRHLQTLHGHFPSVLIARVVQFLTRDVTKSPGTEETIAFDNDITDGDISYDMCIASWANWLLRTFGSVTDDEERVSELNPEDVVVSLATSLGPDNAKGPTAHRAAQHLLKVLCDDYPHLSQVSALLCLKTATSVVWDPQVLPAMEKRLEVLLSSRLVESLSDGQTVEDLAAPAVIRIELPPGWRTLSASDGWKPAPIGSANPVT